MGAVAAWIERLLSATRGRLCLRPPRAAARLSTPTIHSLPLTRSAAVSLLSEPSPPPSPPFLAPCSSLSDSPPPLPILPPHPLYLSAPHLVLHRPPRCFVTHPLSPSSPAHVLFLAASPSPSASVLLRAWSLPSRASAFAPASLALNPRAPAAPAARGLAVDALPFGLGVRLAGSVNAVALHSLAAAQIWILAARTSEAAAVVELSKCAVIELSTPIYAMAAAMGCLILGEVGRVRAFPLRPLIKGRAAKKGGGLSSGQGNGDSCKKKGVLNGVVVVPTSRRKRGEARSFVAGRGSELRDGCRCNGEVEGRVEGELTPIKLKMLRIKQNSENSYSFLVAMNCASVQKQKNGTGVLASAKAVSVHALSKNKFLILDSVGDLHVLSLRNKAVPSGITDQCSLTSKEAHTYRLDHPMKIQLLAVLPNTSAKTQVVWVSDGAHTVHMMSLSDIEYSVGGNVEEERKSTMIQISAIEAIFVSEKVRDIVPISSNAVLVLGQGNIFVYGTA
ncbi:uncharacterized protein LOC109722576 [Ananas comosus]|uniref:Uncharacterized protein LOC109722576 n=1 Tax=Ananas comosus TaxID=4615 RepID=A0A6P5GE56_ANACO|nr:uncharacterized protein LOC109722576 [Ananas comosus]